MKKSILSLAAAALVVAACNSPKPVHIADFTITIPASYEVMHQEDHFPNSAAIYLKSEDGEQIALNNIVYYSDEDLKYLDYVYEGIEHFLENKIIELFNSVDEGPLHEALFSDFTIEDIDEIQIDEEGVGRFYFNGVCGEDNLPWKGGIIIYLNNGALVKQLAIADTDEQIETLFNVAEGIVFDPHEGSYAPEEEISGEEGEQ